MEGLVEEALKVHVGKIFRREQASAALHVEKQSPKRKVVQKIVSVKVPNPASDRTLNATKGQRGKVLARRSAGAIMRAK